MFRVIPHSITRLKESGTAVDERSLEFQGFDHNDSLEGHMANYVKYSQRRPVGRTATATEAQPTAVVE